jgi:hypothetical protein
MAAVCCWSYHLVFADCYSLFGVPAENFYPIGLGSESICHCADLSLVAGAIVWVQNVAIRLKRSSWLRGKKSCSILQRFPVGNGIE